jgi:hypothetical protein
MITRSYEGNFKPMNQRELLKLAPVFVLEAFAIAKYWGPALKKGAWPLVTGLSAGFVTEGCANH